MWSHLKSGGWIQIVNCSWLPAVPGHFAQVLRTKSLSFSVTYPFTKFLLLIKNSRFSRFSW
jgi:hypothetical protein